ncbi:MAG: RagB/SusD family nutrient uptake outer membrane protein [Weeksellaceae bacterium]|nr:RagB/SusD family nutrient uptake outer membrane protein [Bacteroidota bacterium]MCG2779534.1 RagB/SusD family nutrient uptake outer membrane protein [Weeksellaceae bacterium]
MNNFKTYIIALFAILLTFQSCREDYLNDPQPTTSVSPEVVFGSKEGATAFIAGILRNTRAQFTATDTGNLGSMYFARTNKGNDVVNSGSWFGSDYENNNREPNYRRTAFTWNFLYYLINQTNALIEGVEESTSISQADKGPLLGQAYAMRAFFYFELSLEFQHTYKFDTSLPAPPIYDKPSQLEGKPMSTQSEMYAFIISDIEKSLQIGSSARMNKSYFNKQVAHGIAARVYQVMGNWPKAAENARAAYGGNVNAALSPEVYKNGFDDMDAGKEWMLASPQTDDQSAYYYTAPHGFFTQTESAYNNTYINKNFKNLFTSTDVRNTFVTTTRTDYRQVYTKKFVFSFHADVPLMRTPEMILIEAEALYYSDPAAAHNLLYALQVNRDPSAVMSANSGQALLDEIMVERRKELYGELGVEWYDAKRLRKGLPRDQGGVHRLPMTANPLMPDDKRFFLKIPQSEIDANPNIPSSINNNR